MIPRWAALALATLALAASFPATADDLPPGTVIEGSLAAGEIRAWTLPAASSGTRQRVRVDQRGLDVELTLRGGDLDVPWKIDGPFDRDGVELLLIPEPSTPAPEPWTLELRALASAGGSFQLRVDEVDPGRFSALEASTEAGRAWAEGTGDGRRRAVDAYRRAADAWRALAQPLLAVQSLYAVGVLQRLLGESEAALTTCRRVLPLWRGLGKPGRALWDRIEPGRRLLLVPDGALWRVPFAALPIPGSDDERILDRAEVIVLPSASILARVRDREAPADRVAVLADPVFDRRDLRLADAARPADVAPGLASASPSALPRLRMSRLEAESIIALAPPGSALAALDFDADKALVTSGRLADFRFVHLATHGLVDDRHPALSGLVLSAYDRRGESRDAFLALGDIYRLRLRADLVVLSACRTALGKEVDGAGLVGLTRGFLHAGARSVAASLWSVGDRSTAELMASLYEALLADELPPSTALRRAQSALRRDARYADPHHWAGFVLIGG